jgi:WD40 repeat protein
VIEIPAGQVVAQGKLPAEPFGPQTFSPDGRWLVTLDMPPPDPAAVLAPLPEQAADLAVILHAFPTGNKQVEIPGPSAPSAYAFHPDGRLLAIGYQDGSMSLWDLGVGEEIFGADFCSQPVTGLAFTPDGESLAISDGRSPIRLLDLTALGRQLAEIGLQW